MVPWRTAGLIHSRGFFRTCWIKRFIVSHGKRHPPEMGELENNQFLSDLAVNKKVSVCTQNQALSAILFLYLVTDYRYAGTAGLHEGLR